MNLPQHQYIDRDTRRVMDERLYGDRVIAYFYSSVREQAPVLFRALSTPHITDLLSLVNYELPGLSRIVGAGRFARDLGVDLSECVEPAERLPIVSGTSVRIEPLLKELLSTRVFCSRPS